MSNLGDLQAVSNDLRNAIVTVRAAVNQWNVIDPANLTGDERKGLQEARALAERIAVLRNALHAGGLTSEVRARSAELLSSAKSITKSLEVEANATKVEEDDVQDAPQDGPVEGGEGVHGPPEPVRYTSDVQGLLDIDHDSERETDPVPVPVKVRKGSGRRNVRKVGSRSAVTVRTSLGEVEGNVGPCSVLPFEVSVVIRDAGILNKVLAFLDTLK